MSATPWGSIIGAIAGHIDNTKTNFANLGLNAMTNLFNRRMNQENNDLAIRLANQANQWQIEQRDYENWYNSPAGLQSRGLNPALAMSASGGNLASSGSAGSANVATPTPFRAETPSVESSALLAAQIANINADTAKKHAETQTEEAARQARIDNLNAITKNMEQNTQQIIQNIDNLKKQGKLTDQQVKKLQFDQMMEGKRWSLDVKRYALEAKLTDAQVNEINAQTKKTLAEAKVTEREYDEMVWTYTMRYLGLSTQVGVNQAQINQANATANRLGLESQQIQQAIDINKGTAISEKGFAEALQGKAGTLNYIVALIRANMQMAVRDIGGIVGAIK